MSADGGTSDARMDPLLNAFLAALPEALRADADGVGDLGSRLTSITAKARAECPGVDLSDERIAAHIAGRLPSDRPLDEALGAVHATDLFLACACGAGDAKALALLEQRCLRDLDPQLARTGAAPALIEEIKQGLRRSLLVGDSEHAPGILSFAGRGPLGGWLSVIAQRQAVRAIRAENREGPAGSELDEVLCPDDDPELQLLRARYRTSFKEAISEALGTLSRRERTILRYRILEGLGAEETARIYHVHAATVGRWLAAARKQLYARTRKILMGRLRLGPADADSMLRLMDSRIELSLQRLLQNR